MENNGGTERMRVFEEMRRVFKLTEADEQYLKSNLKWFVFKKGYVVDGQNEILQNMIYVNRGVARTYYIENGREHNYGFTFASHFIVKPQKLMLEGELQIFVQFLDETEVCYIPLQTMGSLTDRTSGEIYKFMNMGLINHIVQIEEQMFMLRMDAKERYDWVVRKYPHLLELVSVTQLASFLNLTKETLYRIRSGKY